MPKGTKFEEAQEESEILKKVKNKKYKGSDLSNETKVKFKEQKIDYEDDHGEDDQGGGRAMRKTLIILLAIILLPGCETWNWGETYHYHIPAGEHGDINCPAVIQETEVWGGEMTMTYNPDRMVDTVYNFSYWSKLGGMMPDITSNFIEGKHQSARAAWRLDPTDVSYIYLGYIVYVYGLETPERGYLLTTNGEKVRVPMGSPFHVFVSKAKEWWSISVYHGGKEAYIKVEDEMLKRERFMVVMEPWYGGEPPAPTGINFSLKIKDTTWLY